MGDRKKDQLLAVEWQKKILLWQKGIRREFSYMYTPEQNGVAERKNRSIVDAARAMLEEKSMPKFYWAEAVRTAIYIQNCIGENVSAHELYFGCKENKRTKIAETQID